MAENLQKQPKRGILKASTSFEQREHDHTSHSKNPHFDEMNILATFHPPDKDYGFMKIEEPKTPFEYASEEEEEEKEGESKAQEKHDELDANLLAAKIASEGHKGPRPRKTSEPSADEEDLQLLSPEERDRRKKFEQKRKMHYNEFYAVKIARQLMEEGNPDEEEEEGGNGNGLEEKIDTADSKETNSTETDEVSTLSMADQEDVGTVPVASPMDTDGTV